jgi:hypothetical protein
MLSFTRFLRGAAAALVGAALACTPPDTPPPSANVTVEFPGSTPGEGPLFLFTGNLEASCVAYEAFVADPTVLLSDVSNDPLCTAEIDAFAPSFGAFAMTSTFLDPSSDAWLDNAIASGSLAISLPGEVTLPVRTWLVASAAADVNTAKLLRDRLMDKAYPVLATLGTGFTLDTSTVALTALPMIPLCSQAGAISTNPAIYDASSINVYFVRYYGNIDLTPAQNCWMLDHPEIIFISWGHANVVDPTLAHELGHALGLVHPNAVGGHTDFTPGFVVNNFMSSNAEITNISVGQLYAMSFSKSSWINRPGSPLVRPVVKECQDTWGTGKCPALTQFVPGWPP